MYTFTLIQKIVFCAFACTIMSCGGGSSTGPAPLADSSEYYERLFSEQHSDTHHFGRLVDIDSNVYKTIVIGDQEWMAENLKVVHYRDGSPIAHLLTNKEWAETKKGTYTFYNNSDSMQGAYGNLYNFAAVVNPKCLCPEGWHVPTNDEWKVLEKFAGGSRSGGRRLKKKGTQYWNGTDYYVREGRLGFNALAGGYVLGGMSKYPDSMLYSHVKQVAYFWTSTVFDDKHAWQRSLGYNNDEFHNWDTRIEDGLSVRCIKDK